MTRGSALPRRLRFWRGAVATLTAAGFLWMIALSVSPSLHASVHADANDMAHHCGATLLASGNCENPSAAPPLIPPMFLPGLTPVRVLPTAAPSRFLVVSVLEHAPPALA